MFKRFENDGNDICHNDDHYKQYVPADGLCYENTEHDKLQNHVRKEKTQWFKKPLNVAGAIILVMMFSILFNFSGKTGDNM